MKAVIREQILAQLLNIPALMDLHLQQSVDFIPKTLRWFIDTEKLLSPHRLPVVSRISGFRGQLQATEEGYVHPQVQQDKFSLRKKRNATAVALLQASEEELRKEIESIDELFTELRDKLAQLIAIVSAKSPLPHSLHITESYLGQIWTLLSENAETLSMSKYIEVKTNRTDRNYLLQDLMANVVAANSRACSPPPESTT